MYCNPIFSWIHSNFPATSSDRELTTSHVVHSIYSIYSANPSLRQVLGGALRNMGNQGSLPSLGELREKDNSLRKFLSWQILPSSFLSKFSYRTRLISLPMLLTPQMFVNLIIAFWGFLSPFSFFLFFFSFYLISLQVPSLSWSKFKKLETCTFVLFF